MTKKHSLVGHHLLEESSFQALSTHIWTKRLQLQSFGIKQMITHLTQHIYSRPAGRLQV